MTAVIDLRSDTVTQPTTAMRRVMSEAEVGDDVFGDDPTVIALEEKVADLLGKEAALFVPSGTMANQIAVRCHTQPGDRVLLDANAHIYFYEAGAIAALSGVIPACLDGALGVFTAEQVTAVLLPDDVHFAPARLVCIENTHNRGGGKVWTLEQVQAVTDASRESGLRCHLDGARLWNAAVALGVAERDFAACFDSVSVCFSKGLGAPVGSALAGSAELIHRARRVRKQFGGGMRQAGVLAAAAIYALDHHRERVVEDHEHARRLAEGLAEMGNVDLDPDSVETNIVRFQVKEGDAKQSADRLDQAGVRILATGPQTLRAVTNLMVDRAGIETALDVMRRVF